METGDHFKNGAGTKSQTSSRNLLIRRIGFFIAISTIIAVINASAQNTKSAKPVTLTVIEIRIVQDSRGLNPASLEVSCKDEHEKGDVFRYATGDWYANTTFENVTNTRVTLPEKVQIVPRIKGNILVTLLSDKERLLFEFEVKEVIYSVGVGVGTQFVVKRSSDGKIILLPQETVNVSPPPAKEN